jgi:hypothetical protein
MFESEYHIFSLSFGASRLVCAEARNKTGRKGEKKLIYEGEFLLSRCGVPYFILIL